MKSYFGIDIGGTNVKIGVVSETGDILYKIKYNTASFVASGDFIKIFSEKLKEVFTLYPSIFEVGIGVPGAISKDKKSLVELTNIPELNGVNIVSILTEKFPNHKFYLENDANAAALGEYHFGKVKLPESFCFITLGTGVGGGAIIDGKLFTGGHGNGVEIGHLISSKGKTIEDHLGKKGLLASAKKIIAKDKFSTKLIDSDELTPKAISKAFKEGDKVAEKVFQKAGKYLGECIVGAVRILDVETIVIGGGIAEAYSCMEENVKIVLNQYLTPYYLSKMEIKIATLKNEAGIIGAASLCVK